MTTSDWITLGAAILTGGGTLFLGIMAWRTIRQARNVQKAEKRERLLNEIIEWALDVAKCGIEKGYPDISNLIDLHSVWQKVSNNMGEIVLCFKEMRGKNQYIGEIVKTLPQDLQEASQTLIGDFEEHIRLLSLCETYMRDREKAWEKAVGHKHRLNSFAKKVIEEAAKIKTENIGKKEENMSKEGKATGSNEPTLKDIEEHLKQQDIQMARTQWQWLFILGVSAMAVGLAWIIATTPITQGDFKSGLFVFLAGLLIALLSLFYRYRKKS